MLVPNQTPFIKDRLHNSFEVGYTLAREKLDDKCLEIFNVPGYTPDEEKRDMDIMENSEAEYSDLTGTVNEAMARLIVSLTEDTPPRPEQPNPLARVEVAAPPAPTKPRMTLTKETPPRQMEQFLAAFKIYYKSLKMEEMELTDVLTLLYDSCSLGMMNAIIAEIGTNVKEYTMWGRSADSSVEGIIRKISKEHYPTTARRHSLF